MYYYKIYNKQGDLIKIIYSASAWELEEYANYPDIYDIEIAELILEINNNLKIILI